MEKLPYIDRPLPILSTRRDWHPFSSRKLPVICARMTQEELVQLIGGDMSTGGEGGGISSAPAPDGSAPDQQHSPNTDETTAHDHSGSSERSGSSGTSPPENKQNFRVKPRGQPNRPGSGGYNLEKHLTEQCKWTREQFLEVQARICILIGKNSLYLNQAAEQGS